MTLRTLARVTIGAADIFLATLEHAAADSYVLLGNGVCRPAGQSADE